MTAPADLLALAADWREAAASLDAGTRLIGTQDVRDGSALALRACADQLEQLAARAVTDPQPPPPVHRGDPDTARQAAARTTLTAGTTRARVLAALAHATATRGGATDYELGQRLRILRTTAGKRRVDLVRMGLVEATAERRPTDTRVLAVVWRTTEVGSAVAARLAALGPGIRLDLPRTIAHATAT